MRERRSTVTEIRIFSPKKFAFSHTNLLNFYRYNTDLNTNPNTDTNTNLKEIKEPQDHTSG